ncbi:MAG: 23S rRNA (adenine(2503)-C(2))-methyltransferase RlmN [Myxococcota bacterium]|nr:23S rRNA (adenine(2503)-C(2))-methyltransferase RlmN [Myxococcota bacterium]
MSLVNLHPALARLDELAADPPTGKPSLIGYTREELTEFIKNAGEKSFRADQLYNALFARGLTSLQDVTTLSKSLRAELESHFTVDRPTIDQVEASTDGTRKYRFVGVDGLAFEAVYIPEVATGSRTNTLCVSSQTGCAVGCKFCFTASIRRNRNLAAAEIVGQVLAVQEDVKELSEDARVTNIVFMGMGEPLLNYDHVLRSCRILLDPKGMDFSSRRITIRTSGIVPRIHDLGRDLPTQLAISLNATTDATRNEVMPINKKWPLKELIASLHAYPLAPRRKFTIEYVMLKDLNDSTDDAYRLIQLLKGLPVKVNLLPLNEHDRTPYQTPPWDRVETFQAILRDAGMTAIHRRPRGQDISAACGQLGETVPTDQAYS